MLMELSEFKDRLAGGTIDRRGIMRVLASVGIGTVSMPLARRASAQEMMQLFTWSGYDVPEIAPAFVAKYGRMPDASIFADNDEAVEKIRAGYVADIASPSSSSVVRWIDGGLVEPIDTSRLSNWPDVFDQLRGMRGTTGPNGEIYYAPLAWGNTSVVFRTDMAPEYVGNHSWNILFDPKYAGRIASRDNWQGTALPAALVLGIENPWAPTDEDIALIGDKLREQRELVRFYWSSETDAQAAVATGEIVAMYAWNSAYAALKKEGVPVEFMNPKEGLLTWVDGHVLLKEGVGSDEQRYDFLDAALSPETGAFMINEYAYGACNRKSFEIADQELIATLGMTDPEGVMANSLWYELVPGEVRQKLINLHDEVLAGA